MGLDDSVKKFIVNYLLTKHKSSTYEYIRKLYRILRKELIVGEKVIFLDSEAVIVEANTKSYGIRILVEETLRPTSNLITLSKDIIYIEFREAKRLHEIRGRDIAEYIDSITKLSWAGRIIKSDIFSKDTKRSKMITFAELLHPNNRALNTFGEDFDTSAFKGRNYRLKELLDLLSCDKIDTGGIENTKKFFEIFAFCEYFSEELGITFSSKELGQCLLEKRYNNKKIALLHMILYYRIRRELIRKNKYISREFFFGILEICHAKEIPGKTLKEYSNYQWEKSVISSRNWKNVIAKLFAYIYNILGIKSANYFETLSYNGPEYVIKRLEVLHFLVEGVLSTKRYKDLANYSSKRKKNYISASAEYYTSEDSFFYPTGSNPSICIVDDIEFICVGNFLYILRDSDVYPLDRRAVKTIIKYLDPSYKDLKTFISRYYNSFYRRVGRTESMRRLERKNNKLTQL